MNGRVYEPVLGRFLSADPFMPGSLGSQAMNRYAYVGNHPASLIDPSGNFPRNGNALKQWRNGPGTLDALELAINYSWNRWGGVRNVSDGMEGTNASLFALALDMAAHNTSTGFSLSVLASNSSIGYGYVSNLISANPNRFAWSSGSQPSGRTSATGGGSLPTDAPVLVNGVWQFSDTTITQTRNHSPQLSWNGGYQLHLVALRMFTSGHVSGHVFIGGTRPDGSTEAAGFYPASRAAEAVIEHSRLLEGVVKDDSLLLEAALAGDSNFQVMTYSVSHEQYASAFSYMRDYASTRDYGLFTSSCVHAAFASLGHARVITNMTSGLFGLSPNGVYRAIALYNQ